MTRKTASSGRALLITAGFLATVLVFGLTGAAGADSFTLTVVAQTTSTITFTYPQQPGYGYLYSANGTVVSRTNDPTRVQIKFAKANTYEVAAIVKGTTGSYPVAPPPAACADGIDNDGDTLIDYPADPGCSSAADTDEANAPPPPPAACANGLDDDTDGKIDYPADPGCTSATDTDESDPVSPPPSTITPSQFAARATAGATIENVTVTGDVTVKNPNVTLRNVTIQGTLEWYNLADGGKVLNSRALDLLIWGADNLLVDGNTFDGGNHTDGGKMWDMAGDYPQNVTITNNVFKNQNSTATDPSRHSQAIYVGYSDGVLISGNTFVNNGSTSDIFFSWYTETNPSSSRTYPRNVCVKGNSFSDPNHLHYFAINFRAEITTVAHIVTDPNEPGFSTTSPQFNGIC